MLLFFAETINYPGQAIRPGKLEISSTTNTAIQGMKDPKNQSELKSFLSNVFRRFASNLCGVVALFKRKLRKDLLPYFKVMSEAEKEAVD